MKKTIPLIKALERVYEDTGKDLKKESYVLLIMTSFRGGGKFFDYFYGSSKKELEDHLDRMSDEFEEEGYGYNYKILPSTHVSKEVLDFFWRNN